MADRYMKQSRHARLRDLMAAKVEKKYLQLSRAKALTGAQREFIGHELDALLHTGDNSEAALNRIVHQLKALNPQPPKNGKASQGKAASMRTGNNAREDASTLSMTEPARRNSNPPAAAKQPQGNESLPPIDPVLANMYGMYGERSPSNIPRPGDLHKDDKWAQMAKRDVEEYQRDMAQIKGKQKEVMEAQRRQLDQQVQARKHLKVSAVESEKEYAQREEVLRKRWEEEAKTVEARKKERHAIEKVERDRQLKLVEERKKKEEAIRRIQDQQMAEKIQREYQAEQEAVVAKKHKAKEAIAEFIEYNKVQKKIREARLEKEAAEEKEHQKMFLERLEKQDREREQAFAKLQEKMRRQFVMATEMADTIDQKAADDEARALKEQEARDKKARDRQEAEERKRRDDKARMRQYLEMQVKKREEERKKEHEEHLKEKEIIARELKEAEEAEKAKRIQAREKVKAHRRDLAAQMEERSHIKLQWMTPEEEKLNRSVMKKLHMD